MQAAGLCGQIAFEWVEHHADPEPPARVAGPFVEPEQRGIERRRREQREIAAREVEAVQAMTQRHEHAAVLHKRERTDVASQRPLPRRAGRGFVAMQRGRLDVDPIKRRLRRHPGR